MLEHGFDSEFGLSFSLYDNSGDLAVNFVSDFTDGALISVNNKIGTGAVQLLTKENGHGMVQVLSRLGFSQRGDRQ